MDLGWRGREMAGAQTGNVPVGCGQDFGVYSRDHRKPLVGIKQGQDMVWLYFYGEQVIRV